MQMRKWLKQCYFKSSNTVQFVPSTIAKLETGTCILQLPNAFYPFEEILIVLEISCDCPWNYQSVTKLEKGTSENVVVKTEIYNFFIIKVFIFHQFKSCHVLMSISVQGRFHF